MSARSAVFASLALGVLVLRPADPARSTTKHYFELKSEQVVDLSVFSQPNQVVTLDLKAWVATTLTDSAGGKVVHVIVDSLRAISSAPQFTPAMADSAKGGMVHGFVDPSGRVKNLTSTPAANQLLIAVQGIVNGIFPRIKKGANAGDRWTDTTEIVNKEGGNNTTIKLMLNYTAAGTETVAGVPAIKVTATSTSVISGTAENAMAGTMVVEGTGVGNGTFWIGADGRFLGGDLSSTLDQKLTITGAPAPIPVKVTQQLKVTALP
jgi:hypothetical protein